MVFYGQRSFIVALKRRGKKFNEYQRKEHTYLYRSDWSRCRCTEPYLVCAWLFQVLRWSYVSIWLRPNGRASWIQARQVRIREYRTRPCYGLVSARLGQGWVRRHWYRPERFCGQHSSTQGGA